MCPKLIVPLQIDRAIDDRRYLIHGTANPAFPEACEVCGHGCGERRSDPCPVWREGRRGRRSRARGDPRRPGHPGNRREREHPPRPRRCDHQRAVGTGELTETTGRALCQLGEIARDADAALAILGAPKQCDRDVRHLVPCPAVEGARTCLRRAASPLLEEERDAGRPAAVTNLRYSRDLRGTGRGSDSPPAMTHPMPARSISPNGPSSGSQDRKRTAAGTVRRWLIQPVARALDADTHPCVVRPGKLIGNFCESLRALGQQLVRVLRRVGHDIEHGGDEVDRDPGGGRGRSCC